MRIVILAAVVAASASWTAPSLAHGGGLNAEGCHNDRRNGGYHCHRGNGSSGKARAPRLASSGGAFANCAAARAAGAAPVLRGDPGYSARLDRDNDGVGCE